MDENSVTVAGAEESGEITGWRDFQDRVRAAMAMAASQGADLTLVDHDFVQWPIGERSVMEAFHQWTLARKSAHCDVLAAHFEAFPRSHPRWVTWRSTWGHRVKCWQASEDLADALAPILVVHGCIGLRLHETLHGTGVWTRNAMDLRTWLGEIDVNLQRSREALPPTTLGL